MIELLLIAAGLPLLLVLVLIVLNASMRARQARLNREHLAQLEARAARLAARRRAAAQKVTS